MAPRSAPRSSPPCTPPSCRAGKRRPLPPPPPFSNPCALADRRVAAYNRASTLAWSFSLRDPEKPSNAGRNALVVIVLLLVAAGVVALLRGGPPEITARSWPAAVGRQARLDLAVHADM